MTTPTQAPGIHQLPEPCWTVLKADGEGAGYEGAEIHSRTREEAEQDRAACTDPDTGENTTRVVQNPVACWAATLMCGEEFVYDGDVAARHFTSREEVLDCVQLQDGMLTPDGQLTCGADTDCETCTPVRRALKQQFAMRDTHPDVLTHPKADPVTDPTEIDWEARRRVAKRHFWVVDGRPVNPIGSHLKYGRGQLWHWGEAANADAIVFAITEGYRRWVLLIKRGDGHGWGFPGGGLGDGESAADGALRELKEETGLDVRALELAGPVIVGGFRYVHDPREAREAWMVTAPVVIDLGKVGRLPDVAGADDAAQARWFQADTSYRVRAAIAELGDVVFPAHGEMLDQAIYGELS